MTEFIPYGRQWVDDDDVAAVVAVLRGSHLTQGSAVESFERALAERVGARHCVAFCNATAALHAAVKVLDLPTGSRGITSPATFVASANCMAYNGLVPAFADIDSRTLNIDPDSIDERLDERTHLLVPVHFAGQPCDMVRIGRIARQYGLRVIEDAAHAIGSVGSDGSIVGSCRHSDMTVFSFHPVKTVTTGEGGAVTTNDAELDRRLRMVRSHGITKDPSRITASPGPWYYEQQELGFNFRITDIQCALGESQLAKLDRFKARRREIVNAYNKAFQGMDGFTIPLEVPGADSCFHLYVAQIDFGRLGRTRAQVMEELQRSGVGTQVHYIPVHLQPWYRATYGYSQGLCPVAESVYEQTLSLPLYPRMDDEDVRRVVTAVRALSSSWSTRPI